MQENGEDKASLTEPKYPHHTIRRAIPLDRNHQQTIDEQSRLNRKHDNNNGKNEPEKEYGETKRLQTLQQIRQLVSLLIQVCLF